MNATIKMFWMLGVFFLIVCIVYTAWHLGLGLHVEWVGTLGFLLGTALSWMISIYMTFLSKAVGPQHNDALLADVDDADPDMGEFAPWSWWPFIAAGFLAIITWGFSIQGGIWLAIIGFCLIPFGIVGFIYEQYRGRFNR